jgi:ANTAR domain-containing protein
VQPDSRPFSRHHLPRVTWWHPWLHRESGSLPDADLALGQALADVATIGILSERAIRRGEVLTEQLQTALTSRVMIEQAKGVLAHHFGLGMDQAFNLLRGYARSHNQRLADVARRLTGKELDPARLLTTPTGGTDVRRR